MLLILERDYQRTADLQTLKMNWALLLLALIGSAVSDSVNCPVVKCTDSLPQGQCFQRDPDSFDIDLQPCAENYTCEFNHMESSDSYDFDTRQQYCRPDHWVPEQKFPGERCLQSRDCLSNQCAEFCVGLPADSACKNFADCAPGLICLQSRCRSQVPLGGACDNSFECVNDSLCYKRRCTDYFSQPLGAGEVNDPFLCESGYAKNRTCAIAPANKESPDSPCYGDDDCELTDGEDGTCLCGLNPEGVPFCASAPGDEEFQWLKTAILSVVHDSRYCHFNTSLTLRCPQHAASANFTQFLNALYIYYYRPAIIGVKSCVISVMPFAANYSYANVDVGSSSDTNKTVVIIVAVCVFAVLLCLGIISFLCVRRYAQQENSEQQIQRRIRNNELAVLELFVGSVPERPAASTATCRFAITDLAFAEKDRRFLRTGIPVAVEVHEETHEPVGEPDYAPPAELSLKNIDSDTSITPPPRSR